MNAYEWMLHLMNDDDLLTSHEIDKIIVEVHEEQVSK